MILRSSLLAAAVVSLALVARADDMGGSFGVSAGPAGMNMQWNVNDPNAQPVQGGMVVQATASKHEEQTVDKPGEHYKISWDSNPGHHTQLKVLAPEGLGVRVSDGGSVLLQDSVPATVEAQAGHFLRVELFTNQAVLFDKKIEAKPGMVASLWVTVAPPPQAQVQVQMNGGMYAQAPGATVVVAAAPQPVYQQPAPQPMPAASPCMDDGDFSGIRSAVEGESFSNQKLSTLETALSDRRLCVAQVVQVLGLFDFGNDKIAALKMMAPRINDRGNNYKVYSAFDFDSEKQQAKAILK